MNKVPFLTAALIAVTQLAAAVTFTATASKDNTIFSESGNSSGASTGMYAGKTNSGVLRRALVAFDLSSIPVGSTVTSVTVRFRVTQSPAGTQPVALHRATAAWGQGTSIGTGGGGQGAAATTNDATWAQRIVPSTNWASPGGDFITTASASATAGAAGTDTLWTSTAQLVADVQGWVSSPSSNQGWIVIGNEPVTQSAKEFATSEFATAAQRPTITVQYTTNSGVGNWTKY